MYHSVEIVETTQTVYSCCVVVLQGNAFFNFLFGQVQIVCRAHTIPTAKFHLVLLSSYLHNLTLLVTADIICYLRWLSSFAVKEKWETASWMFYTLFLASKRGEIIHLLHLIHSLLSELVYFANLDVKTE